jgi:hypothetical protein
LWSATHQSMVAARGPKCNVIVLWDISRPRYP